ncbi:hypothetical protein ACFVU0_18120 [Streptomyces sp. NPDC058122]
MARPTIRSAASFATVRFLQTSRRRAHSAAAAVWIVSSSSFSWAMTVA